MTDLDQITEILMQASKKLSVSELTALCSSSATFSLGMMRGMHGEEFVRGFLNKEILDTTEIHVVDAEGAMQ